MERRSSLVFVSDFVLSFMWVWSGVLVRLFVFKILGFSHTPIGEIVKILFSILNMFLFAFLAKVSRGGVYNPLTVLSDAISRGLLNFLFCVAFRIPAQVFGSIVGVKLLIDTIPEVGQGPRLNVDIHQGALTEGLLTFAIVSISLGLATTKIHGNFFMKTWISSLSKLTLHILGSDLTGGCMNPAAVMGWAYARGSASATLRSDSQSQRPSHSIHVNPKYLERQRLQQSSRTKGVFDDMAGVISNANEDAERPDRALGAARPWLDPRLNMHNNQHTHRGALNDSVPEKSIGGAYGDDGYNSSVSNSLGSGVGRTGSRLIGGVAETLSGQRNGFSLKHSFSNHEAPKSVNLDAHSIRSSAMSKNWKNSEEEEFMWDEVNPGLSDNVPNVSNNLSSDPWMADEDNLESEDHLQITHPIGTKVNKGISTVKKQLPSSGGHSSLSWELQKQVPSAKLNMKPGHSEIFVSAPNGLPKHSNSSAARIRNQSSMPHTTIGMSKITGQQQFDSN